MKVLILLIILNFSIKLLRKKAINDKKLLQTNEEEDSDNDNQKLDQNLQLNYYNGFMPLKNNMINHIYPKIPVINNYHMNKMDMSNNLNHKIITHNPYNGLTTKTIISPYNNYRIPQYMNNINSYNLNSILTKINISNSLGLPINIFRR